MSSVPGDFSLAHEINSSRVSFLYKLGRDRSTSLRLVRTHDASNIFILLISEFYYRYFAALFSFFGVVGCFFGSFMKFQKIRTHFVCTRSTDLVPNVQNQ